MDFNNLLGQYIYTSYLSQFTALLRLTLFHILQQIYLKSSLISPFLILQKWVLKMALYRIESCLQQPTLKGDGGHCVLVVHSLAIT